MGGVLTALLTTVLVFWNPRGIRNKETIVKDYMGAKGAIYAGVPASQTYRSSTELSDRHIDGTGVQRGNRQRQAPICSGEWVPL